jgi:hypothetical protein
LAAVVADGQKNRERERKDVSGERGCSNNKRPSVC